METVTRPAAGTAPTVRRLVVVALAIGAALGGDTSSAQTAPATGGYTLPAESVRELFERDKSYATIDGVSPDGAHAVVPLATELSTLARMSRTTYRLAMLELRPAVDREWRLDTAGIDRLRLFAIASRTFRDVELPDDTFVSDLMWSPDSSSVAFLAHRPARTEVWTLDVATAVARRVADAPVVTLGGRGGAGRSAVNASRILQWTPDGSILTLMVPAGRGPEPERPAVAHGPIVRRTRDEAAPTRTLPFLLADAHDEALFRHYTTAQLVELAPGRDPRPLGEPGMFLDLSLSPDGDFLLTERIVDPLSTIVGYSSFGRRLEVRDRDGAIVSVIRDVPLNEDATQRTPQLEADLPRRVAWQPAGATLGFLWRTPKEEDAAGDDARRDRIVGLSAPFDLDGVVAVATTDEPAERFEDVRYAPDATWAFATVRSAAADGDEGATTRVVAYATSQAGADGQVIVPPYDPDDVLALPGGIHTRQAANGLDVAVTSSGGDAVYLEGPGYQADYRPRPFLDRVVIATGATERVFQGAADAFERPLVVLDPDVPRLIVARESMTDFPDSYLWTSETDAVKLTDNTDPFPEITGARRIDFEFPRRDGLTVRGRISLPVGYRDGARVPAIFWTYPREYASAEDYERAAIRSRNANQFTHLSYLRWSDIWLTQGYAVVYPDVPIVREGGTANDKYIQHLVDSLYGAIRAVDRMGYVDVDRIGHGGHSYGAFATANLLAHSPFFKAGIAGDGAYNRSLTPMGFQSERRFIWDAPDVYLDMSPFFDADQIDTPLLMYHGQDDNNSGTFLIQSERLMQVLTGLGKTAALYIYPYESHGPRAKESYLDLWARWLDWFDRYVKQPGDVESSQP